MNILKGIIQNFKDNLREDSWFDILLQTIMGLCVIILSFLITYGLYKNLGGYIVFMPIVLLVSYFIGKYIVNEMN